MKISDHIVLLIVVGCTIFSQIPFVKRGFEINQNQYSELFQLREHGHIKFGHKRYKLKDRAIYNEHLSHMLDDNKITIFEYDQLLFVHLSE